MHFYMGNIVRGEHSKNDVLAFLNKAGWQLASEEKYLAERKRQIETRTGIYADET